MFAENIRDLVEKDIELERLGDDRDAAGGIRTRGRVRCCVGGERDDRDAPRGGIRFQAEGRRPTIEARQGKVHQNQIRLGMCGHAHTTIDTKVTKLL